MGINAKKRKKMVGIFPNYFLLIFEYCLTLLLIISFTLFSHEKYAVTIRRKEVNSHFDRYGIADHMKFTMF